MYYSHVLAAYAGFLWEMEDEDVEDEALNSSNYTMTELGAHHEGSVASASS